MHAASVHPEPGSNSRIIVFNRPIRSLKSLYSSIFALSYLFLKFTLVEFCTLQRIFRDSYFRTYICFVLLSVIQLSRTNFFMLPLFCGSLIIISQHFRFVNRFFKTFFENFWLFSINHKLVCYVRGRSRDLEYSTTFPPLCQVWVSTKYIGIVFLFCAGCTMCGYKRALGNAEGFTYELLWDYIEQTGFVLSLEK